MGKRYKGLDLTPFLCIVAQQTVTGNCIKGAKVTVLGLTFKENCSDLRNSKVTGLVQELEDYGIEVYVHDPLASAEEARDEYGITLREWDSLPAVDAVVLAVAHADYLAMPFDKLIGSLSERGVVIDVKACLDPVEIKRRHQAYWRL